MLPNTHQSLSKAIIQRETKKLEHSRSSSNLKPIHESSFQDEELDRTEKSIPTPSKESLKRHRRKSSAQWTIATPQERQRKLEDVAAARLVDSFFSLHVDTLEEPLYVSEIVEKAMNPNFRLFDLSGCSRDVIRQNELTVKVWAKNESMQEYQFLIEWKIGLTYLQYVGKTLDSFDRSLPINCVVFHLSDGIYTDFTSFSQVELPVTLSTDPQKSNSLRVTPTASYETLMRLSNLDDCIQDTLVAREQLMSEINEILRENEDSFAIENEVGEAHESLESTKRAVEAEARVVKGTQKKRNNLQGSIQARLDAIREGRKAMETTESRMQVERASLQKCKDALRQIGEEITGQRRRICEDLIAVYPIEAIPNRSLAFTIRGLYLPNSENLEDAEADVVAAALGHAAQVVHLLSFYFSVPLPYPLQPYASKSTVSDLISIIKGNESREFPLYIKGAVRYRFEYGVFLLNKNIEILLNRFGLRIMDIRQTLPNLKYLLYVATAGKGELPARKAGGVRGLPKSGSGGSTPVLSRQGSVGSEESDENVQQRKGKGLLVDVANGQTTVGKKAQTSATGPLQGSLHKHATTQSSRLRDVSR